MQDWELIPRWRRKAAEQQGCSVLSVPCRFQRWFRVWSQGPSLHPLQKAPQKSWLRLSWQRYLRSSQFIMTVREFPHKQGWPTTQSCLLASLPGCRVITSAACHLCCHQQLTQRLNSDKSIVKKLILGRGVQQYRRETELTDWSWLTDHLTSSD